MDLSVTPTLLDELIVEILLRLPVKSLVRFKCVCKSWFSLISDPQFAKSHFDLAAAPTHRLLLQPIDQFFYLHYYLDDFSFPISIDIEALFHDDSAVAHLAAPLPVSPRDPDDLPLDAEGNPYSHPDCFEILGSCRGFILLRYICDNDFIIWNPSTGAHKSTYGSFKYSTFEILCGLGYDAATDDYLGVTIMPDRRHSSSAYIRFFSFKTNSWNQFEAINFSFLVKDDAFPRFQRGSLRVGLFLNGALHWLYLYHRARKVYKIISFDLIEKSLSEIPLPHEYDLAMNEVDNYDLMVNGGCLSLYKYWETDSGDMMVELWMMKEYKVQSSWTKFTVLYSCLSCFTPKVSYLKPICLTEGGGFFVGSHLKEVLLKLNGEGELLEYRADIPNFIKLIPLREFVMYRESLLPLPADFGGEASKDDQ